MVKSGSDSPRLSRRERQIMDIIYELGEAAVAVVLERMADPPSYSAVRAMIRILEEKGHLKHKSDGPRYVYKPTVPRGKARTKALRHLLKTFFQDSTHSAVEALLDINAAKLSDEDFEQLTQLIEKARAEGK